MEIKVRIPGLQKADAGPKEKNILHNVLLDDSIECGGGVTDECVDGGPIGTLMAMHGIGGVGDGVAIGIGVGIGIGTGGDGDGGDGVGGGGDFIGTDGIGIVVGSGISIDGGGHTGIVICIAIGLISGTGTLC